MEKEKNKGEDQREEFVESSSTRARNRTVMLTPEITGQVRAQLARETGSDFVAPKSNAPGGFSSTATLQQNPTRPGVEYKPQQPQHQLPPTAPPMQSYAPQAHSRVVWSKLSPIVGFLVSYDSDENGEIYELRSGRLIVTSEPAASGNYMVVASDTVSPMHAILRISQSGEVQVLDQLSEHGTKIRRFGAEEDEELSGDKSSVEHGDTIKFGDRTFNVCLIAKG